MAQALENKYRYSVEPVKLLSEDFYYVPIYRRISDMEGFGEVVNVKSPLNNLDKYGISARRSAICDKTFDLEDVQQKSWSPVSWTFKALEDEAFAQKYFR
jgi:hypothetical protein